MRTINKIFVVLTFVAMIVINVLANTLPINGVDTGMISDAYPNLFAPAGITFAIWGVIYFLLLLFTIYQLGIINKNDEISNELLNKIGTFFIISSVANSVWIFTWHYQIIWLSMIFMIIILISLINIVMACKEERLSAKEKFFVKVPFSIYFGWISVATIANTTTLLVSLNFKGFGIPEYIWTVVVIIIGAIIGIITLLYNRDYFYGLVFIWAYIGIIIKHITVFNSMYTSVIVTATICIICFILADIYAITKKEY